METSIYGYELVSSHICVYQIIGLRNNLWYLGVPILHKSYMFVDHKYIFDSDIHPYDKLNNHHTVSSFHRVWEAILSNTVAFSHVSGGDNPDNILSNHWSYSKIWKRLQPFILCMGYTMDLLNLESREYNGLEKG